MKRGFTLIELLVTITIVAILSLIGLTIYSGIQKSARDAKRKADVEAIAKAYEANYSAGSYPKPKDEWFGSGGIPQDPNSGDYYWNGSQSIPAAGAAYTICAKLEVKSGNSNDKGTTDGTFSFEYNSGNAGQYFCRKNLQ